MYGKSCSVLLSAIESSPSSTPLVSLQKFYDKITKENYYQAVWSAPLPSEERGSCSLAQRRLYYICNCRKDAKKLSPIVSWIILSLTVKIRFNRTGLRKSARQIRAGS
jgi:hypothetical protein